MIYLLQICNCANSVASLCDRDRRGVNSTAKEIGKEGQDRGWKIGGERFEFGNTSIEEIRRHEKLWGYSGRIAVNGNEVMGTGEANAITAIA